MENWFDSIIIFLFISSALLLALGIMSFFVVHVLKIRGKARLWICSIVILMPLVYPLQSLFPDHIKFLVPIEGFKSFYSYSSESIDFTNSKQSSSLIEADKTSTDKYVVIDTYTSNPQTPNPSVSIPDPKRTLFYSVNWRIVIALAWVVLFLFILVRFALIIKKIKLLLKCADSVTDPYILALLKKCSAKTGLRRIPRLLMVDRIMIPMAVGLLYPTIVIPKKLLEPEFNEGLQFTLLHELKHLQRHDHWWLLVESLVGAAYFFHPVIYWAKQKIHEEWEYICDSHVIQVTNKSVSYADFLLHEIWNYGRERNAILAVPFILSTRKTTKRVYSILGKKGPTLFTKIRDRIAVYIISLSFILLLLSSFSPSAHVKESEMNINQVASVENPDAFNVPAKFDSSEKSTPAFSNNMSVSALPEKTPDKSAEVIHSPLRNNPKAVNTFYVSASEGILKGYDIKAAVKGEVETAIDSQTFSKNNKGPSDTARIDIAAFQEHTGIDVTNIQPVISEKPVKEDEFNSPMSFEVASLDLDEEKRLIQLGDDYSVIIPADLIEFDEDDEDEKTAPSNVDSIPEKYNLDGQLERVSKIWKSAPVSWKSIDYQSFILENGFSYYLIVLNTPDYRLPFRETLQIGNWNEMIRPGYDNVNGYIIHRIYRFKDYEQVKAIRIQLGGDKNKTDVDANTDALGKSSDSVSIPKGARIYDWKFIDDRNIIIRTQFYGSFKATLAEGTPKLSTKEIIGVEAQWPYELDEHSSILLSNGNKCRIEKLVPYTKKGVGWR